jgi:hypothetical protein
MRFCHLIDRSVFAKRKKDVILEYRIQKLMRELAGEWYFPSLYHMIHFTDKQGEPMKIKNNFILCGLYKKLKQK